MSEEFKEPIEIESITKEQIRHLMHGLSSVGMIIVDWSTIDYELGRGKFGQLEHCLWTTDGKRISISIDQFGGAIVSQSKGVDPLYEKLKKNEWKVVELCPDCGTDLVHTIVDGEDVFGCTNCKKEFAWDDSKKVRRKNDN